MNYYYVSDKGLVRSENQDSFAVFSLNNQLIGIVCDGMGGAKGGSFASQLAIKTIQNIVTEQLNNKMESTQIEQLMSYAISYANRNIHLEGTNNEDYKEMGTTVVSAVCNENYAVISNVGDSRAYLLNQKIIAQISKDHSLVENMIARGELTQDQAKQHPSRHLITRALGPEKNVKIDSFLVHWQTGDSILLCSDGLVNTVTDEQILNAYRNDTDHDDLFLQHLMTLSRNNGAPDNVTIVLLNN